MCELGGRSQSARTYLEKNMEALETASVDEVRLLYALHYSVNDVDGQLRALNESNVDASDLTSDKCEVAIVELNTYTLKSAAEVTTLLTNL
jgi:20S proteasome subunit alpha 6